MTRYGTMGIVATVAYLAGLVWLGVARLPDLQGLDLNELGDFTAGAFAPLAALWLILGFKGQAEALSQAKIEFSAAVSHQLEAAELLRQQTDALIEQVELEKERLDNELEPRFAMEPDGGRGRSGEEMIWRFRILNTGAAAHQVELCADAPLGDNNPKLVKSIIAPNDAGSVSFRVTPDTPAGLGVIRLQYIRDDGRQGIKLFVFTLKEDTTSTPYNGPKISIAPAR